MILMINYYIVSVYGEYCIDPINPAARKGCVCSLYLSLSLSLSLSIQCQCIIQLAPIAHLEDDVI